MKSMVIYATKYGCTEKAAKILQSKLEGETLLVNIMKEKVPPLDSHDTVILGGSIYMGKIQKELTNYITGNLPVLLKKRTGLFLCAGSPNVEERAKELAAVFPSELYAHSISKEVFGYEFNFEKLNFLDKIIMKAVKGDKGNPSDLSEEKISSFAKAISLK